MSKLVIFDWDGTLADSVSKIIACKQFLAEQYHYPIPSEQQIRKVLGQDFHLAMQYCFPTISSTKLQKIKSEYQALMQTPPYQAHLFPYALETIQQLKNQGIKLAIATSKSSVELMQQLKNQGLENFFDMVCCAEQYLSKPNPLMIFEILNYVQVNKDDAIMVGDAITDIQFARNAGIKVYCVTFGAQTKEILLTYQPEGFFNNWREFFNLMEIKNG